MAVNQAMENRVMDVLLTALNGIGTPSTSWLTDPSVEEGIPPDSVDLTSLPRLFAHHVRSEVLDAEAGMTDHRIRAVFHVYCLAIGGRAVLSLKADVLRAVFAAEGAFTTAFKQPMYPLTYGYRDDLNVAGIQAGVHEFAIDLTLTHTDT